MKPQQKRIDRGMWWDKPWTLVSGCTRVSPACDHCWALAMEHRFGKSAPAQFHLDRLDAPSRVLRPSVFACWNDLFHENVATTQIWGALDVMEACSWHQFMVLTKRARKLRSQLSELRMATMTAPEPNVWLGVTAENQATADERIPLLLQTPAAHRFISIEPGLSNIELRRGVYQRATDGAYEGTSLEGIDLVILGAETGPGARPMDLDWARSVRDQCTSAGVPFFYKRGSDGSRELDGRKWEEMP